MLMTFLSPRKEKQRWKLYFGWLPMFPRRSVGMLEDWRWCEVQFPMSEYCIFLFFPWLVVYRHSYLKFPCSNPTIDKRFYLQKHILELFLFRKIYQWLIKIWKTMLALKVVFSWPSMFNKMSWIFEFQRRISFIFVWT
jgi:hypothetical protein